MTKKKSKSSMPKLIGVIHLPPLPGSVGAFGQFPVESLEEAGVWATTEAKILKDFGFEGLIIENFGDAPFYKDQVPAETIASMAVIASAVRLTVPELPIGINVLRNDSLSALKIAAVTGCDFIRVNVLTGVVATDQGLIQGGAAELMREKARLGADIKVLADIDVKHAVTLHGKKSSLYVEEVIERGKANGVIVTGPTTGRPIDLKKFQRIAKKAYKMNVPLLVGSGVGPQNIGDFVGSFSNVGVIVGSSIRERSKAGFPLDKNQIKLLVDAYKKAKKTK